jgi:hypothetical protein
VNVTGCPMKTLCYAFTNSNRAASTVNQAFRICFPLCVFPIASLVLTALPETLSTGTEQERVAEPSICTVQAAHCAIPRGLTRRDAAEHCAPKWTGN